MSATFSWRTSSELLTAARAAAIDFAFADRTTESARLDLPSTLPASLPRAFWPRADSAFWTYLLAADSLESGLMFMSWWTSRQCVRYSGTDVLPNEYRPPPCGL